MRLTPANVVTALLVLLLVAAGWLWLRSFWTVDCLLGRTGAAGLHARAWHGRLFLMDVEASATREAAYLRLPSPRVGRQDPPDSLPPLPVGTSGDIIILPRITFPASSWRNRFGLGSTTANLRFGEGTATPIQVRLGVLSVPYWLVCVVLLVPLLRRVILLRRR